MRPSSVRTKLTIAMAATAVSVGGLLGAYLIWSSYSALRDQAQSAQLALARILASQVDQGVGQAFQAVSVLAARPDVVQMERGALLGELSLVTSATELLDALLVVLPDGKLYAQSRPGISQSSLPPASLLSAQMDKVKHLHDSVLADIYKSTEGEPVVSIRAPILRNGDFVGTLVGVLQISKHSIGNLEFGKIGADGYAYLVSDDGVALAHPNRSRVFQDVSDNPAVKEALRRKEGIVHFSLESGPEIMAAFARVDAAGWSVVVRQPAAECYAPALHMLKVTSVLLVVALLIAAFLAAELARRLSRPVLALTDRMRRVEAEEVESESLRSGAGRDEIGDLARTLADMSDRLKLQRMDREKAHRRALDAEKKLSESERLASLGQLAAGLAHELNNPLTVIQGAAQVLPKGQSHWAREILKETRRCKRLVADLLNFAKPIKLELATCDLNALCQEAWEQVKMPGNAGTRLEISRQPFVCVVDPERFKQVFINLLGNSLDAMKSKGRMKVLFRRSRRMLRAEIWDSGPGFQPDEAEVLFRPFFTKKSDGTGLGLPIARAVMQAHGGRLWAELAQKGGAVFIAEWPALRPLRKTGEKEKA